MKNPSPLSLLVLLLVVLPLPPAAAVGVLRARLLPADWTAPDVECVGDGVYAANSTYEANRLRLAGLLLAAAPSRPYYADLAVGYWPNRPQAIMYCTRRDSDGTGSGDSLCAACIAGALLEVDKTCPYHREASFYSGNCTLEFSEFRIFGTDTSIFGEGSILRQVLASGLIFQAIGFGWLFFLLMQEWRSRKRGTMMHATPLLSGD